MRIYATFCQFIAGFQNNPVHDFDSGTIRNQIGLRFPCFLVSDYNLTFLLGIFNRSDAAKFRNNCKTFRLSRFKKLLYTGKTLCNIVTGYTARMESTHRKLRTRLSNRLGCDNADRFTYLNRFTCCHIRTVAFRTDTIMGTARENRTDFYLLNGLAFFVYAYAQNLCCTAGCNHVVFLYDNVTIPIPDFFTGISAVDSVFQSFNRFFAIHKGLYGHARDFVSSFATIHFPYNQFLGNVYHTPCQIP